MSQLVTELRAQLTEALDGNAPAQRLVSLSLDHAEATLTGADRTACLDEFITAVKAQPLQASAAAIVSLGLMLVGVLKDLEAGDAPQL